MYATPDANDPPGSRHSNPKNQLSRSNNETDADGDDADNDDDENDDDNDPSLVLPTRVYKTTTKHIPKTFACPAPECDKRFPTLNAVKSHLKCHMAATIQCEVCDKVFRRNHDLVRHKRSVVCGCCNCFFNILFNREDIYLIFSFKKLLSMIWVNHINVKAVIALLQEPMRSVDIVKRGPR